MPKNRDATATTHAVARGMIWNRNSPIARNTRAGPRTNAALRQRTARRDGLVLVCERRAATQRGEHRDQRHRDDQRNQHRERDRQRLIAEQLTGDALHEHERKEHGYGRQRRRRHGHADFGRASHRGFDDRRALLAQARDIFEHDDRIVDDHAGRERKAAERHHIERQMQLAHEEERCDQRHRQRERNDERAPRVAEEEENDQDREHAAEQRIELHFAERVLDEDRLILDRGQLRAFGQRILEFFHLRVDRLGNADRVGIAFLVDRELDRLAPVDAHDAFAFLVALRDRRDVLQANRHVAVDLDQELAHLVEVLELVDRAHEKALAAFVDAAAGGVDVLVLEARDDFVDVEPSRASCCWSIETSISSSRPPPTLTAATPVTGSMRFLRSSSAKRRSCLSWISLAPWRAGCRHSRLDGPAGCRARDP